ncbi:MAG: hypothetical protein AAGG11_09220 [Pseudomonadota bacterium]
MSGDQKPSDEVFEAALRARLEAASRDIGAPERERLDSARRQAVARASTLGDSGGDVLTVAVARRWVPTAALTAVALLAVLALPRQVLKEEDPLTLLESGDIAAVAELELLEDLELLAWLDEQDPGDAS